MLLIRPWWHHQAFVFVLDVPVTEQTDIFVFNQIFYENYIYIYFLISAASSQFAIKCLSFDIQHLSKALYNLLEL